MSENQETKNPTRGRVSIGQAAARRREQLNKLKETEQRRQEAFRQERERLAREVAELEVQERRIQRQKQLKEKQRACFVLGELLLNALKTQGLIDFSVNRSDLDRLRPELQALVQTVVMRGQEGAAHMSDEPPGETDGKSMVPDVPL